MNELYENICPLYLGKSCPICDDEWCDLGISYEEAQEINRACCERHYFPTDEEIAEMFRRTKK